MMPFLMRQTKMMRRPGVRYGELQKIKFYYKGPNVEAVLDRLPTAKILQQDAKGYLISAEVFGVGIEIWLRSQGDMVEVMEER